ncbi:unnamed protein product [Didymodactylos carnosus]|uniref:Uncharacterized protein n=1 Tax=Didymodactylos carnosus TaxID=1234261 RepID=A0A8S2ECK4_9BILA|nr:unnamed protein product [Didymodactylos carnosus]CAF3924398.1 unnamed protein product [Didymodactylos carnosus]
MSRRASTGIFIPPNVDVKNEKSNIENDNRLVKKQEIDADTTSRKHTDFSIKEQMNTNRTHISNTAFEKSNSHMNTADHTATTLIGTNINVESHNIQNQTNTDNHYATTIIGSNMNIQAVNMQNQKDTTNHNVTIIRGDNMDIKTLNNQTQINSTKHGITSIADHERKKNYVDYLQENLRKELGPIKLDMNGEDNDQRNGGHDDNKRDQTVERKHFPREEKRDREGTVNFLKKEYTEKVRRDTDHQDESRTFSAETTMISTESEETIFKNEPWGPNKNIHTFSTICIMTSPKQVERIGKNIHGFADGS